MEWSRGRSYGGKELLPADKPGKSRHMGELFGSYRRACIHACSCTIVSHSFIMKGGRAGASETPRAYDTVVPISTSPKTKTKTKTRAIMTGYVFVILRSRSGDAEVISLPILGMAVWMTADKKRALFGLLHLQVNKTKVALLLPLPSPPLFSLQPSNKSLQTTSNRYHHLFSVSPITFYSDKFPSFTNYPSFPSV